MNAGAIVLDLALDTKLLRPKLMEIDLNGFIVPQMAHLLASLVILKEVSDNPISFEGLQAIPGFLSQISAGMPGPCLIYLEAIKQSSFDELKKMHLVNETIHYVQQNRDTFAPLSHKTFKMLFGYWTDLFNGLPEVIKDRVSYKFSEYTKELMACLTDAEINEKKTIIDDLIINGLSTLNIATGSDMIPLRI